jgi:hypothetical protein
VDEALAVATLVPSSVEASSGLVTMMLRAPEGVRVCEITLVAPTLGGMGREDDPDILVRFKGRVAMPSSLGALHEAFEQAVSARHVMYEYNHSRHILGCKRSINTLWLRFNPEYTAIQRFRSGFNAIPRSLSD